jgi:AcrR family transcriptional regulator
MLSMATSKKRRYHHGALRDVLLSAGGELLSEVGAERLSLREVARRIGVSHNAPYKHFPSREALLAALAGRGFAELTRRVAEAGAEKGDPAVARGLAYVCFALEHPALFRLMFSGAIDRDAFSDVHSASALGLAELGRFVGQTYDENASAEAVISVWAFVHGLAQLLLDSQIPPPMRASRSNRELARDVLIAMSRALTGEATKPPRRAQ